MERFVIIVNGFQPLTIITKRSILDVAAALDPPLFSDRGNDLYWAFSIFLEKGRPWEVQLLAANLIFYTRSSRPEVLCKKRFQNISPILHENTCPRVSFLIAGLHSPEIIRPWYWCFLVNFVKFLRKSFWRNTSGQLLLKNVIFTGITKVWRRIYIV